MLNFARYPVGLHFLDGSLAIEAARARTPNLILLDILLPGLGGFEG
jgi:DNA-binding response OmpR family regulator